MSRYNDEVCALSSHQELNLFNLSRIPNYLKRKRFETKLPIEVRQILLDLKSGDICIDVGANVGLVSEIFLSRGAFVYALEPHPNAFKKLLEVKRRYNNLTALNACAGVSDAKVKLYLHTSHHLNPTKHSTGSSLFDSKPNVGKDFIIAEAIDFAEFLSRFPRIRILKIDIEGYEVELIPHLIKLKALKNIDHIFVETHEKKWPELMGKTMDLKQIVSESLHNEQIRWDWP